MKIPTSKITRYMVCNIGIATPNLGVLCYFLYEIVALIFVINLKI